MDERSIGQETREYRRASKVKKEEHTYDGYYL